MRKEPKVQLVELFDFARGFGAVEGIEKDLRERRWRGTLAGVGAVIVQVATLAASKDYLSRVGHFFANLFSGNWDKLIGGEQGLDIYQLLAVGLLVAGAAAFLVLRNTHVLLRDSTEPFRYTFSVAPFRRAGDPQMGASDPSSSTDGVLSRLHLDLINRLSDRHQRLSLLDPSALPTAQQRRLDSHIHVSGQYVLSQKENDDGGTARPAADVEVMPRVRIGPPEQPERVVDTTHHRTSDYEQIVREVQAHVEKAMYAQILGDIRKKILLYPTSFRRAVGLFYEAEDFEHSNTIDAYDHAITLYREALRYFDSSWTKGVARLLWLPAARRSRLLEARARVAFSRCLIFRRLMSATAGRRQNPVYEVREQLERALSVLEKLYRRATPHGSHREATTPAIELITRFLTYPRRRRSPRWQASVEACRAALFEAYVVSSLFYSELPVRSTSQEQLDKALATCPDTAEQSALYLLAKARLPTHPLEKQRFLQKATEYAARSETIHYRYALVLRSRFLQRNDLSEARAKEVVNAFARVQELNPGNIASYAACGNVSWLTKDLARAESEYQRGMNVKAIQQETFVAELSYGLARITAELGEFERALHLYQQSIDANPNVAACATSDAALTLDLYSFMTNGSLARYKLFLADVREANKKFEEARNTPRSSGQPTAGTPSERTCNAVLSFALNDCANAYFNRYTRAGVAAFLDEAIKLYVEAESLAPHTTVVPFNLSIAYSWSSQPVMQIAALQRAAQHEPSWGPWLMALLEDYLNDSDSQASTLKGSVEKLTARTEELTARTKDLRQKLDERVRSEPFPDRRDTISGNKHVYDENGGPLSAVRASTGHPTRGHQLAPEFSRQKLQRDLDESERELLKVGNELLKVRNDLKALTESATTRSLPLLGRVLANSRFAGLFPLLHFDALDLDTLLSEIKRFASDELKQLNVAHVDEEFLDLLRLLSRVCTVSAYSSTEEDTLGSLDAGRELSKELYLYIVRGFNTDDFVAHQRLLDLYDRPTTTEKADDRRARCKSISAMQGAIRSELADDPQRWWLLKEWAQAYWHREVALLDMTGEHELRDCLNACQNIAPKVLPPGPLRRLQALGIDLCPEATLRRHTEGTDNAWLLCNPRTGASFRFEYREPDAALSVRFFKPDLVDAIQQALLSSVDGLDQVDKAVLKGMWATKCRERGERDDASRLFEEAAKCDTSTSDYLLALGDLYLDDEDCERACHAYRRAIAHAPQEALERLSKAEQRARKPGQLLQQVSANLRALRDLQLPVDEHPEYKEYNKRILELEQEQARLARFGEPLGDVEFVPRIVVELGEDLVNVVDPKKDGGEFIDKRVLALRDALKEQFGISVPGVRFRGSYALVGSQYTFMIDEIPTASGVVESDGRPKADALLNRLGALLRPKLALFLDVEELERLCARWQENEIDAALLRDLLRDRDDRVNLARILRALLSEQIPIVDTGTILGTLKEVGLGVDTLGDTVELLRQRMKQCLPGNAANASRIERPSAIADILAQALSSRGRRTRPRLAPQARLRLISEINGLLTAHAATADCGGTAIILDDGAQRVLAQRTFESSFPGLMWLSRGELLEDEGNKPNADMIAHVRSADVTTHAD
jgi:tetratricopeptide (TPR) repeat protein